MKCNLSPQSSVLVSLLIALLSSPTAAQDLRVFDTRHYRVHTDLDGDLSDDLSRRLDTMYDEYARRLSGFQMPNDTTPLEVYIVHSQQKYLHLAGITMAGTGGSFNYSRHLLAAFLDGQGRDALRRTLQHEAFHQFAAQTIGTNLPTWLNEGLAQIFEEGVWTGDGFLLGQVPPWRLRQLRQDMLQGSLIDLGHLLTMPGQEWAANFRVPAKSATQYNQSWAIVHFLIYATDENGQPRYRSRLIDMLKYLHGGLDGKSAFTQAFSDNITGFHDRFLEFAQTLQPTPLATLIENQGVLADMLAAIAQRGRSYADFGQFHAACLSEGWRVQYRRSNLQWESDPDAGVYFSAPSGYAFDQDGPHFEQAAGHPLADLVCHCDGLPPLRTRFIDNNGKIDHETIVDAGQ